MKAIESMSILAIHAINNPYYVSFRDKCITGTDSIRYLAHDIHELICDQHVDCIYLLTGPGSFTSMRIAIITAVTLSIARSIPIKACNAVELFKNHSITLAFKIAYNTYKIYRDDVWYELNDDDSSVDGDSNNLQLQQEVDYTNLCTNNLQLQQEVDYTYALINNRDVLFLMLRYLSDKSVVSVEEEILPYYISQPSYSSYL